MSKKTKAYQHTAASRMNIPTDRDQVFMTDEDRERVEFQPEPAGTGGPVLSWRRGSGVLNIKTVALPLYIHEKVNPSAFIEQLTRSAAGGEQMDWFQQFNGLPAEAKYDWYKYKGHWSNRIIRGNSVDVLASLAAKEGMGGEVQMIFFDPPYGIEFKSNYQSSTRERNVKGSPVEAATRKAFRDTYIDGLHSYMDSVFKVAAHARVLLANSGSFFLQIGTENVHRLSIVLDEVFGPENRVATITFAKTGSTSARHLSQVADYLLWYAKDKQQVKYRQLYEPFTRREMLEYMSSYAMVELSDGTSRNLTPMEAYDPDKYIPSGARLFRRMPLTSQGESTTGRSDPYHWNSTVFPCPPDRQWSVDRAGIDRLATKDRLIAPETGELSWKKYEEEVPGRQINNLWHSVHSPSDMHYVVETAESVAERCILMATDPGDLVLDPTCGSGTTAAVAERYGRRWITIDASAIPVALCRQRILASIHKWYLTLDDSEGQREEARLAGKLEEYERHPSPLRSGADPASGFVYERIPYASSAHLAYDEAPKSTLLLSKALTKKGVRRVSAPFTVESHSPWVYVSPSEPETDQRAAERETGIRENVLKALEIVGIPASNDDGERWHFDDIDLWEDGDPASHITHEGILRGSAERVAIAAVPDDRTAGIALIDAAARTAVRGDFKKLVLVAFHFEPDAKNERRGKLEIVLVRANRDLTIGELKSGKEDNAFVLIGEPDVQSIEHPDGMWVVTIKGYNVYDPGSGNVRSGCRAADIDCWMLDTNYDGKSFFARRIHFPGKASDKQIKRLKRDLGSRVDSKQWEFMGSLTSAPFRCPSGGRIAVRIVTSFGDEMLSVLTLGN